jgi:hypothetical protein
LFDRLVTERGWREECRDDRQVPADGFVIHRIAMVTNGREDGVVDLPEPSRKEANPERLSDMFSSPDQHGEGLRDMARMTIQRRTHYFVLDA